jgi:hypothetical protein
MPNFKNTIIVNREEEKRFYRVMKELEKNGESIIKDASAPEWQRTLISLGHRTKPLLDNKTIEQPLIWNTTNRRHKDMRLIHLPNNIIVEEKEGNKESFFHFKRRSIV